MPSLWDMNASKIYNVDPKPVEQQRDDRLLASGSRNIEENTVVFEETRRYENFSPPQRESPPRGNPFQERLLFESSGPSTSQDTSTVQIPEFDPDKGNIDVYDWLNLFNEVSFNRNWSLQDKKFHFANKLAGSARRWFLNGKMVEEKWGTITRQFKKAFPSEMHFYEQLTTMMNRVKAENETISNYFYHKIALINDCGFSGVKAVSCLIGGLPNYKVRSLASGQGCRTPEDLYTFLCKYEGVDEDKDCALCKNGRHCGHKSKKDRTMLNQQGEMYQVVLVNKYVVDVFINGSKLNAYVSMDSNYVTIREEDAYHLKIKVDTSHRMLKYFGRHAIKASGIATVRLRVDNAVVDIDVYIVSNSLQVIPVVIGRAFSHSPSVKYKIDDEGVHYSNIEDVAKEDREKNDEWLNSPSKLYRKLTFFCWGRGALPS